MCLRKIPITITSVSSAYHGVLFVPKSICQDLKIQPGFHTIQCGGLSETVRILYPMHEWASACAFSADLVEKLALIQNSKLFLYNKGGTLHLGPVVGIFANVRYQNGAVVGQQALAFEQLLSIAAEERIYAYLFGPQNIDNARLRGYVLLKKNGRNTWHVRNVPSPDSVYDQIVSRKYEQQPEVKQVKEQLLKKLGNCYFNPSFFDKWQVHQWLSNDARSEQYLPKAIKHTDVKTTSSFLQNHNPVYIKPNHGSLGVGIIKVVRLEDGRFFYQIKGRKGVQTQGTAVSSKKLLKLLKARLSKHSYLVQMGISLATYKGRPFDIRVVVQKDHTGQWKRTKSFCRIAQSGDITSNLSTGGDALSVLNVLREIFGKPEDVKKIQRKISELVNLVPKILEEQSGYQLGELGLDIAIDRVGGIWVIEVNSRPWKKTHTEQGSMAVVRESFRRPLLYANLLAGIS